MKESITRKAATQETAGEILSGDELPTLGRQEIAHAWISGLLDTLQRLSPERARTLRLLPTVALVFQLSTAAAQAQSGKIDLPSPPVASETLPNATEAARAHEKLQQTYISELAIYKGLGMPIALNPSLNFPDGQHADALKAVLSKALKTANADVLLGRQGRSGPTQPLMTLQEYYGDLKEIDPALRRHIDLRQYAMGEDGVIKISPFFFEISESKGIVQVFNLLSPATPLIYNGAIGLTDKNGLEQTADAIAIALKKGVAEAQLQLNSISPDTTWRPAITINPDATLTPEQQATWKQFIDTVEKIWVNFYAERQADAGLYRDNSARIGDTESISIPTDTLKKAGYPSLAFQRSVEQISFSQKGTGVRSRETHYDTEHKIGIMHYQGANDRMQVLYIPLRVGTGQSLVSFDATFLGSGKIDGALSVKSSKSIAQMHGRDIYTNLPEHERQIVLKQIDHFARGIESVETLFGIDWYLKNIMIVDTPKGKRGGAGVVPFDSTTIIVSDEGLFNSERQLFLTGAHETIHGIDGRLGIGKDDEFIRHFSLVGIDDELVSKITTMDAMRIDALKRMITGSLFSAFHPEVAKAFPQALKQWSEFMTALNESNFLGDDNAGDKFGHAQSNPDEFLASFLNSMNHTNWESRISGMPQSFKTGYLKTLRVLKSILSRKANENRLPVNAPIFALIDTKIAFFER